jgi:hypothetical protein
MQEECDERVQEPGAQERRSFPGRHLYLHDPDGNTIEFVDLQGASNPDAPPYEGRARRRAKSHLAKSHLAKSHLAKSHLAKSHLA